VKINVKKRQVIHCCLFNFICVYRRSKPS